MDNIAKKTSNQIFETAYKEKLWSLFTYCCTFFEKYNFRYYGCGGTVLGAVRHGDMIPWDDDIDLYMPREDYNRLMNMRKELNKDGADFICFENEPGYYLPFGKIVDKNTSLIEYPNFPVVIGMFIDIFPIDEFCETQDVISQIQFQYSKLFKQYQRSISSVEMYRYINNGKVPHRIHWKISSLFKKFFCYKVNESLNKLSSQKGKYCVCVSQWEGKVFLSEWFRNAKKIKFGSTCILIPSDYDGYLTLLYGDYMKLPPIEQRKFCHSHVYINLRERLSLEEIKGQLSNGINCVY